MPKPDHCSGTKRNKENKFTHSRCEVRDLSQLHDHLLSPTLCLFTKKVSSKRGAYWVCGIAVLGYFWCGVAVIFISKYGIAVFRVQAVCGEFKFYVAVVGEKNVVSR